MMSLSIYKQGLAKRKLSLLYISFICLFILPDCKAQRLDTTTYFAPVMIDEIVIRASENGFDIKEFIQRIKEDTTFYKAFRSMHLVTYNAENKIQVFEK